MHGARPYDPKKAHEYYIRTRELKGRKKGRAVEPSPRQSSKMPASKGHEFEAFFNNLPLVKEGGATIEEAMDLVKWAAKRTDEEITKAIQDTVAQQGNNDGGKVATLKTLMNMRRAAKVQTGVDKSSAVIRDKANKKPEAKKPEAKKTNPKVAAKELKAATHRVSVIKQELADLNTRLKKAMAEARKSAAKEKRGPTASEKSKARREAKKYRDKNKQKLANKRKRSSSKTSKKSGSQKDSVADLKKKISEVQGRLDAAVKKQKSLSSAAKNG